jgi:hypothetical protein
MIEPWGTNDLMAMAAFRYCLGRRTYIVSACREWLQRHWDKFEPSTRSLILREVEEAFQSGDLGMECDKAEWEKVRRLPCVTK